jgi:hypothetical protein
MGKNTVMLLHKKDCHWAEFHESHACSTTIVKYYTESHVTRTNGLGVDTT